MATPHPLETELQRFIHKHKYARKVEGEDRLETWDETVDRAVNFLFGPAPPALLALKALTREHIYNLEVLPSMRLMQMAGPAAERDSMCIYNCSYMPIDCPQAFSRMMYILMCGTGVGFSVEKDCVSRLPKVPRHFGTEPSLYPIKVVDSREGWALAFDEFIGDLFGGFFSPFDVSDVRPKGASLGTSGGYASGPEVLIELGAYVRDVFVQAAGRKLRPVEVHKICCKIAACVQCGGVRRSATISLSDLDDEEMRNVKNWKKNQNYADGKENFLNYANNSAVYTTAKPDHRFELEWESLWESGSGERGIFSRHAANVKTKDTSIRWGTNPCAEIILPPHGLCNLSTVVVREKDTLTSLRLKVYLATLIGTLQSCRINFNLKVLNREWVSNCVRDRLLGVSMTGMLSNFRTTPSQLDQLKDLRAVAYYANQSFAALLEINPAARITCVKPEGTASLLSNTASGLHPAYAKHYIRRVRIPSEDPIAELMRSSGYPIEPDVITKGVDVVSFYCEAPKHTLLREKVSALSQLHMWKQCYDRWCDHKPSVSIYVQEQERDKVKQWIVDNFAELSGVSFFPYSDAHYAQLPFEEIPEPGPATKAIDWDRLVVKTAPVHGGDACLPGRDGCAL